jgi:hypothetical protein
MAREDADASGQGATQGFYRILTRTGDGFGMFVTRITAIDVIIGSVLLRLTLWK